MRSLRSRLDRLRQFLQSYSQILLLAFVLFIGVASVALGATSIRRSIYAPFATKSSLADATSDSGTQAADLEALKHKDTDGDGLSDYDELYVYHTSPYLKDSDSDGIPDGEEVRRGTDPNCPEGKTCGGDTGAQASAAQKSGAVAGQSLTPPLPAPSPLPSAVPSPAELRTLLKQAGVSADKVDALSDEEVVTAYNAARQQQQAKGADVSQSPAVPLTPQQIRELLLKYGVSQETLGKVSDNDLQALYQQTLSEIGSKSAPPKQ